MSIKEEWHKGFSDIFKGININREATISSNAQKNIASMSDDISRAMIAGNKSLADQIVKELETYRKTVRNEEERLFPQWVDRVKSTKLTDMVEELNLIRLVASKEWEKAG
jgi:Rod binding domain-containing protein